MTNVWKKVGSRLPWVAALAVLSLSSCKKDPCKDVSCQNGGVCVDGNCSCPTAWEGSRCEVDVRDKFIGAWSGSIDCGSGLGNATIRIGKLSGKDGRIAIEGTTIHGRVTSSTEFEIPLQNYLVPDSSAVYVI
ncbi:MAG: calcium-binding EGF-like domain-containing protein, partial [Bacteroidia bacterium]|nr:calcium-binding EGF-like domain-containing protein [Bacteroidia bacterium]